MAASIDASAGADPAARTRATWSAGRTAGLSAALLDRLALTDKRIDEMIGFLQEIAAFDDPVGEVVGVRRPAGFVLEKVRTPIGVIAMIYESRPNVTLDAAALCLKSGNAVILRGGSEAVESSAALVAAVREGLAAPGWTGTPCSTSSGPSTRPSTCW